ncbi:FAD-binding oxidoreductase [Clostridium sp. KNHs216]|uniref:FAD-binding oxidoreductase n=1 Tax=Clostridium sp. KNHs216 TaxID=1550235 RepID=UPI0011528007|nr:FAD-binding oxidoreductase [Clostridium sp. KNHs216]TQI66423.1 FAD/FMN-containing dehydrogenase [Clostridium sp. KNHs216]
MNDRYFSGLTGEVVTSQDPEYQKDRQEWNRAIQKYPLIIVYCYHKLDVSNAVLWSEQHCVPLRIRSGGHNYEGYSTGNSVLIIDVSRMKAISIHENTVTVEGGVSNRELYEYVSSKGYPFPGGTCPTVGLSGYALGGGWGLSCRRFGLGCDSLVELELVDYKGKILTASSECNPDLFWACRGGGGGSFGVIVSMTFRLPPKISRVTFVEVYYQNTVEERRAQFLTTWQRWLAQADERITLIASIYHSQEEGYAIYLRGIFYGASQEARIIMEPFTDLEENEASMEEMSFWEAVTIIGNSYPSSQMFKSTGRFVIRPFNESEVYRVTSLLEEVPQGSVYSALTLYALGGKVKEKSSRETAFFYRDAGYIIGIQSVWTNPAYEHSNVDWVNRQFRYLKSVTEGSYVNFPYSGLRDYLDAYYGLNAGRLREIKDQYDPDNIFQFPQSIIPFYTGPHCH